MAYLLDTNVLSELRRVRPDRNVVSWFERAPSSDLFLSVLVIGEIRRGIELLRSRDVEQAASLEGWLHDLSRAYAERVLAVTHDIAETWGRLNATRPLAVIDSLLLATAHVHGLSLVTREADRFTGTGVAVVDPWKARASST